MTTEVIVNGSFVGYLESFEFKRKVVKQPTTGTCCMEFKPSEEITFEIVVSDTPQIETKVCTIDSNERGK